MGKTSRTPRGNRDSDSAMVFTCMCMGMCVRQYVCMHGWVEESDVWMHACTNMTHKKPIPKQRTKSRFREQNSISIFRNPEE